MSLQEGSQTNLRKQVVLWGVMLAVTSLALFGVLELGLRVLYGPSFSAPATPGYYLDPESGIRLNPNELRRFTRDIWNGGETIPWATNAAGYRGPAFIPEPDYRIALFGDSNIQAQFSELQDTYAMVLQTVLRTKTGRNVEVINAGTIGAGPDQSTIRMGQELPLLRPNLVILHVFADNDFGDLVRNALFYADSGTHLSRSGRQFTKDRAFDPVHRRYALATLQFASDLKQNILASLPGNSGTEPEMPAELIAEWLGRCADEFASYQASVAGRDAVLASVLADHYDYDLALFPELASSRMKVRLMEGVLRRAKQIADEAGVPLVLLIQPSVHDVSENLLITPRMLGQYSPEYRPERLTSIVQDIAARNEIEFINLFPAFLERGAHLYFRGTRRPGMDEVDNHWNDEGQRSAAQLTADVLRARVSSTATQATSKR